MILFNNSNHMNTIINLSFLVVFKKDILRHFLDRKRPPQAHTRYSTLVHAQYICLNGKGVTHVINFLNTHAVSVPLFLLHLSSPCFLFFPRDVFSHRFENNRIQSTHLPCIAKLSAVSTLLCCGCCACVCCACELQRRVGLCGLDT